MPTKPLARVLYLPHGGGPLPLFGDASHGEMIRFLKEIPRRLGVPATILVISAHWEETRPTLTNAAHPGMLYDYYGFPAEMYQIRYPAPGQPQLAQRLANIIAASQPAQLDARRAFDHGLYVPLMLMYPDAKIPCIQLSLLKSLNPAEHIALGKSIAVLREENVLIIGSGMSFHNLPAFFNTGNGSDEKFDRWLIETCTSLHLSLAEREQRLIDWESAPSARFCHPREDHLLPLHVCLGAAAETPVAEVVFNGKIMGKQVSGLLW